ncbi:MAG TPA: GtrA family protein [Caulobacteraceae bacterium]|nr:GtrA family protein [Caulobacteraceae bacterium]
MGLTLDRRSLREFLQFALIGVGGTLLDLMVLWLAINGLHAGLYLGRLISYLAAATFNFALNRRFTFRTAAAAPLFQQWVSYLAVNAAGALVNIGVYSAIVAAAPRTGVLPTSSAAYLPYAADVIGGVCGLVFNFAGSKLFVFRPQSSSSSS